jgi:hypothetical protein
MLLRVYSLDGLETTRLTSTIMDASELRTSI